MSAESGQEEHNTSLELCRNNAHGVSLPWRSDFTAKYVSKDIEYLRE